MYAETHQLARHGARYQSGGGRGEKEEGGMKEVGGLPAADEEVTRVRAVGARVVMGYVRVKKATRSPFTPDSKYLYV